MRNILGIAGGAGLVLLVAVTQIRTAPPTPGGFISGNAFAQEPARSASDDRSRDVGVLQQLPDSELATTLVPSARSDAPAEAAPRPEPRRERRFSQTPDRWALTPTPTM